MDHDGGARNGTEHTAGTRPPPGWHEWSPDYGDAHARSAESGRETVGHLWNAGGLAPTIAIFRTGRVVAGGRGGGQDRQAELLPRSQEGPTRAS